MNIFVLHENPVRAVQYLHDKHVVKMTLETAQLLSTCWNQTTGVEQFSFPDTPNIVQCYRSTHVNHPCSIWLRASINNYRWLVDYFEAILAEYTYRYGKTHACAKLLLPLKTNTPYGLPQRDRTPFPYCMPIDYTRLDYVIAYRLYYKCEKIEGAKWTGRNKPEWL